MTPVINELESTMTTRISKNLRYLLLAFSLTATMSAHSGPFVRSAEVASKGIAAEDRQIRFTKQANLDQRQQSDKMEENEKKAQSKKSHKKDASGHFSKGHQSKKHQQKNNHHFHHHKPKHTHNHHSKEKDNHQSRHYPSHSYQPNHDGKWYPKYNKHKKWKNQHWGQKGYGQSISWRYAGEFQTRKHKKESDITIEINKNIKVVEIEGLGRGTVIHRAYLELDSGRLKRLRALEGYIERRDVLKQGLREHRYAHALHLEVSSSGRKRAFAKVSVGY